MPRLVVEKGNDRGKTFVIPPKGATVFGRDNSATIQIKDTMASRMHFKIEARENGYWVVDLESMNGTLLNNHPVKESQLQPGDLIKVGESMYSFLSDEAAVDAIIGQRFGGYRILERVGRGGMGTVYKAEQVDLQRHVALKIISDDHARRKDFVDLFVHEARAAAKLNHPNIVQVYDVKKHNELYFFSMEFVPGGSVQELLNRQRKMPVDQTVRMILDAARGLEYAHKKDIIHRDVKPDNFMIGESGTIKIGDLGLAQRMGEKLSADDENSVIGTPHYIAPEQVLGRPADFRSDIYALGSTMYRMVAGFTPFQAPSVRDLVNKKAREDATPLHTACPDVPVRIGEICAKMMARNPDQRYQTMSEVIVELEKYVRDTSGQGMAPAGTAEVQVANRRLLLTAVGLLAFVVLGGVVGAVYVMNRKPAPVSPSPTPVVVDDSDRGAEAKLDFAKTAELKLDPKKPEEIQDVIKLFAEIVERWPNSTFAAEAAQRRTALEGRLREFRAQQQLAALEEADRSAWAQILQTFQSGREDLSEVDRSILAFQNFGRDEAFAGTPAAQKAEAWAGKVLEWKAQVNARRKALDTVRAEAGALTDQQKFQSAWELYNRFATETLAIKLNQDDGRYNTLLYETVARKLQERVVEESKVAWYKIEERTRVLEAAGDYKAAVDLCEIVERDFTNDPKRSAQSRKKELWEKITEQRLLAERAKAEEQRRKEEDDARDFETWAMRGRRSVLALDTRTLARDAAKLADSATGLFPRLATTAARLKQRSHELDLLADFRDGLVKAWADPKNSGAPRQLDLGSISGTVVKVTDRAIFVKIGGGGEGEFTYSDITRTCDSANRFFSWARAVLRDPEPRATMGLAVLCFEVGLWERAAEVLRGMERATDAESRQFVVEYKPLAEENRFHDADEIEAQKQFDRLEWIVRDLSDMARIEAAARAIQALKTTYARTRVASDRKTKIEEHKKTVDDRGGKELEKRKREEDYRKIQQMRSGVTGQIEGREKELMAALARLPEPERAFHTAEAMFSYRHTPDSTALLKTLWDSLQVKQPPRSEQNSTLIARVALAYARNLFVQRHPETAVLKVLNEAGGLLKDQGGEPGWWATMRVSFGTWCREHEEIRKKYGDRLAKLEGELQDDPSGDGMWNLAQAREVLRDYTEARIVYTVLLQMFPESTAVKSGDALWRLAEVCYQFRDLAEAKRLYTQLRIEYSNHRKVRDDRAMDGATQRLRQIGELEVKMGSGK